MARYSLKGLGKAIDSGLVESVNRFWAPWDVALEAKDPLPGLSFPTRDSLTQWAYRIYLEHWQQGTLPNLVVIVPGESLGSWKHAWEGTAYDGYQMALVKEQVGPAIRFVATHELGHLLGLPDHYWPPTCLMAWYPWWIVPRAARSICGHCRSILEGRR